MLFFFIFFFTDTATTEIYTLSLHDALPIYRGEELSRRALGIRLCVRREPPTRAPCEFQSVHVLPGKDRKSTRLNSSHTVISYAVFCLKKKKKKKNKTTSTIKTAHIYHPITE